MISPNKKFIFTHIGRTGGASIEEVLSDVGFKKPHLIDLYSERAKLVNFEASQHWKSTEERFVVGEDIWNEYFKFTIVRNPWDRLVSQYFGHVIHEIPGMSIDEYFLRSFVYNKYHDFKRFVQPCTNWISDKGNILVDYVGRFETLQDDFNVICDKIGIEHRILSQMGNSKKEHYRNYYNDYTAELVYNEFKSDIEEFGYEF